MSEDSRQAGALEDDVIEKRAHRLYEVMEELEDSEPPGLSWSDLLDSERSWYRECVARLDSMATV